jgi:two-component system, NtrC family, response regulator AtoC
MLDSAQLSVVRDTTITTSEYLERYAPLLSGSAAIRPIRELVENIANTDATVLIRGESGVGKDFIARAIHEVSDRRTQPFVKVNCAALPVELLESELFGHEKGAFTGAYRRKFGQVEYANKGTLYLDEIGELPQAVQAKLLHVLQDLRFNRVGGREPINVDVRIIAATNRNLELAISRGEFREDLYYRLNVVEVWVPPLRERREEIPGLVAYFLERLNSQYRKTKQLSAGTMTRLIEHPWPGNVRELENAIRRMVVLPDGETAFEATFRQRYSIQPAQARPDPVGAPSALTGNESLRDIARRGAREAERKALSEVLERVNWNRSEAARVLKVSYKTLLNKITECGLSPKRPNAADQRRVTL